MQRSEMRNTRASGANHKHIPNKTATVTAVKPVLPPSLDTSTTFNIEFVLLVPANAPTGCC